MLIIALVLAVIGLAALVFAVVTSNELVAWVCIGASVLGVVLLIIDALQERQRREAGTTTKEPRSADDHTDSGTEEQGYADYPEDASYDDDDDAARSQPADSGTDEDAENTR